jgi:hypothetical protein
VRKFRAYGRESSRSTHCGRADPALVIKVRSTYVHQLRAFAAAVRGEPANLTPPSDSIATMSLIDDIYTAAGLPLRP